jgi:hypothetical protein
MTDGSTNALIPVRLGNLIGFVQVNLECNSITLAMRGLEELFPLSTKGSSSPRSTGVVHKIGGANTQKQYLIFYTFS